MSLLVFFCILLIICIICCVDFLVLVKRAFMCNEIYRHFVIDLWPMLEIHKPSFFVLDDSHSVPVSACLQVSFKTCRDCHKKCSDVFKRFGCIQKSRLLLNCYYNWVLVLGVLIILYLHFCKMYSLIQAIFSDKQICWEYFFHVSFFCMVGRQF